MAHATSSPSAQVLPSLVFDELAKGFTNKEVVVRVIHFWEARNPKKGGLLMGLELLLIDQKSTLIQAFIAANRIGCYEGKLKPGVVYTIKNFLVINNKTSYRVSPHKFLIQFTQQTKLNEVVDAGESIERQKFRIRSFAEFEEAVDMNENLYDAIGKLVLINDDNFNDKTEQVPSGVIKGRTEVHLQLRDGPVVRLTLWDTVAVNFRKRLMKRTTKPVVLLATAVNPRTVRDMFCLSSTSSTRIFFDNDVDLTTEYFARLGEEGKNSVVISNFTSEVVKSEPVTIDELFQFLKNDTPQKATFCCIATIVEISPNYDWHYIACTKCACKLERGDTTLVCNKCNNKNAVGVVRYRVELSVCDKDSVATFVLFDRDATKLTGMRAADILETSDKITSADILEKSDKKTSADILETSDKGDDGGVSDNHSSIPQCLLDVEGHTYKFQVSLTPYNFTATRQTITVTRILEEITDDDKPLQEATAGTNQSDNKEAETSGVALCDVESEDDDTIGSDHIAKRIRHE